MRPIAALLALIVVAAARAQTPAQPRPTLTASRATRPLRIDGRLDDDDWRAAQVATDFVQRYPDPGRAATLRTEVRVLYDAAAIYVAARMYDPHPDSITAPLARRDPDDINSDWFDVVFDSYHDRRTAFRFGVNPAGTKLDVYHFNDSDDDGSWDARWDVATRVDSLGWTAEYRIPLSQLRFHGAAGEQVWGLQFYRAVARRDEWSHWAAYLPTTPGFVSAFGELRGLVGLTPPSPMEIVPYVSSHVATGTDAPGSPFFRARRAGSALGADVRVGLGSALSLSATVNPDFGQVEVDPAVINLSAVETFFPEKRPFFLEGSGIFEFGVLPVRAQYGFSRFVHSRRIGRTPQLSPSSDWSDAPDQTTILGAAKVSGQLGRGWSLGLMDAATQREEARTASAAGALGVAPVEPRTNYFVGRVKRDLAAGRTTLGMLATATNRAMDSTFAPVLRSSAYLVGVDGTHASRDRRWTAGGFLLGSRVAGSAAAIAATQRSSVHYFGRPDAPYAPYDADRRALAGHDAALGVVYQGTPWFASLQARETSPGFETNDLGYLARADARSLAAAFGGTHDASSGMLRSSRATLYSINAWNFGGVGFFHELGLTGSAQLRSFWTVGGHAGVRPALPNDRLTRGGPLVQLPAEWEVSGSVGTDGRRRAIARLAASTVQRGEHGPEATVSTSLTLRPSPPLQLTLAPALEIVHDDAQYVRTIADSTATATFGRRYVFAALRQRTLSLDVRADWTLTTALSVQLFAQPFESTARFGDDEELVAPRTFDFAVYGRDRGTVTPLAGGTRRIDPDGAGPATPFTLGGGPDEASFVSRALRVNAVVRWEYRGGSTLFVVWQQRRDGPADVNVLAVKASYRLGR